MGKGSEESRRCERELVAKLYLETQVDTRWRSTVDKPVRRGERREKEGKRGKKREGDPTVGARGCWLPN